MYPKYHHNTNTLYTIAVLRTLTSRRPKSRILRIYNFRLIEAEDPHTWRISKTVAGLLLV